MYGPDHTRLISMPQIPPILFTLFRLYFQSGIDQYVLKVYDLNQLVVTGTSVTDGLYGLFEFVTPWISGREVDWNTVF